jgi:RNA repair, ligase-Pnkp-associating, region of Hen1
MLLTIRTTHTPATDLGFLLHKHPEHVHTREFPFGNATVFYPEASEDAAPRRSRSTLIPSAWCAVAEAKAARKTSTSTIAHTSHRRCSR